MNYKTWNTSISTVWKLLSESPTMNFPPSTPLFPFGSSYECKSMPLSLFLFDDLETCKSYPAPNVGIQVGLWYTAYSCDFTFNFNGVLLELVKLNRNAVLSTLNPSDELQGIEVKPPKMNPLVFLMTVTVFALPSQSWWKTLKPNPSRLPLHNREKVRFIDSSPIKRFKESCWAGEIILEAI